MKRSLVLCSLIFSMSAFSGTIGQDALKYVPGGSILEERKDEVKVKTPSGTIVEVEFDRSGKFEEASGDSVDQDVFVPENDLKPLKDVVASLTKAGKKPMGEWSLEHSMLRGWHYEFEGFEDGKKMDYVVDAKSGEIIDSKVDD